MFALKPVATMRSPLCELVSIPAQPKGAKDVYVTIEFDRAYEERLKDFEGFSPLNLVYCFHKRREPKLSVVPFNDKTHTPRGGFPAGTLMRHSSPRFFVVEPVGVDGNIVTIKGVDVQDDTPLLDIKPYIENAGKAEGEARSGWMKASKEEVSKKQSDDRFVQQ